MLYSACAGDREKLMLDLLTLVFGFFRRRVSYVAMVFVFFLAFFYLVTNSHFETKTQAGMIGMVIGTLYFLVTAAMKADAERDRNSK